MLILINTNILEIFWIFFNEHWGFSLYDACGFGKSVTTFGVDMSSSAHVGNRKQDILILVNGPTQELDDSTLTAVNQYAINFSGQQKIFFLCLHFNGVKSYLFVSGVEIYKSKAKDSEINVASLCLGNVSKEFSADNMK